MDLAIAQLALIFLPGILWARVDATYGSGPKINQATLYLNSFLFGVTSYAITYLIYYWSGWTFSFNEALSSEVSTISIFADEILISLPVGLALSVLWLFSVRFRWLMRFLTCIGATTRFGTEDVWSFTFNSGLSHVNYVDVRDTQRQVVYSGYVNAYSETETYRELLLLKARIYDADGNLITEAPHLYISMPRENVWIEFPVESSKNV